MPRKKKSPPQLRVKTTEADHRRYRALAQRYGYEEVAPFIRRLLDAADRATEPGIIRFLDGCESRAA